MTDFSKAQDFPVQDLRLSLPRTSLRGKGFLRWDPATGFALDAVVLTREERSPVTRIEIPQIYSVRRITWCRAVLGNRSWVALPFYDLEEDFGFWASDHLTLRSNRALFRNEYDRAAPDSAHWHGGATYRIMPRTTLPDQIEERVTLNETVTHHAYRRAGLDVDLDGVRLLAESVEPDLLRASWTLERQSWPRGMDWHFAWGFGDALGMLLGQRLHLLQRMTRRGSREYTEVRWGLSSADDLGFQAPIHKQDIQLSKPHLVALTRLIASDTSEAFVCRSIFSQLADAACQKTWQARELLTATIVEAILRRFHQRPFDPTGDKWPLQEPLRVYCQERLGAPWVPVADRVFETQRRVRNRNAHPDWRMESNGGAEASQIDEAVDDLIFLSWFYGYVMLSMAGITDVEPRFPAPHKEWAPLATISFGGGEEV